MCFVFSHAYFHRFYFALSFRLLCSVPQLWHIILGTSAPCNFLPFPQLFMIIIIFIAYIYIHIYAICLYVIWSLFKYHLQHIKRLSCCCSWHSQRVALSRRFHRQCAACNCAQKMCRIAGPALGSKTRMECEINAVF